MRGRILSGKLLWWELLVDASECWANGFKKSFLESVSGTMKNNAVQLGQAQALSLLDLSGQTKWRVRKQTYAALVVNIKKLLLEAREGFRCTYGTVCANRGECSSSFSDPFSNGTAMTRQLSLPLHKFVALDALPAGCGRINGFVAMKVSKKVQQSSGTGFFRSCPHGSPKRIRNLDDNTCMALHTRAYEGRRNDASKAQADQGFKSNSKCFASGACISGRLSFVKGMHGNNHGQSISSFGRAFSTSTEKQFDEDVGDLQNPVPGQQQSSDVSQQSSLGGQQSSSAGQQSSLGGQQSSLEVPESKPVGGPSWPNPDNAASYVLMSNIYADGDRWDEVKRINEMRLKARAWKKPGKAYVEIQAKVHEFIVGDRTHQDSTNIYEKLRKIKRHMGHIGYVPYVDIVLENRSYYDPYSKPR
ncbi:hypothetical protein L7F22_061385 [Adiantum nelumboides]|nr:hypothetical protein [Adiantum nelumboides]